MFKAHWEVETWVKRPQRQMYTLKRGKLILAGWLSFLERCLVHQKGGGFHPVRALTHVAIGSPVGAQGGGKSTD